MEREISCHRCGHLENLTVATGNAWDEINCTACGEFIATRDYGSPMMGRSYQHYILSLSIDAIAEMSRFEAGQPATLENVA
ncbi:hypothetical protein [Salinicola avicenniae]|uniref:hypothetical protein n=1 Tax=Salinicola avicenniae TaxID=2916836 RepID=UPI002072C427|nr:MULTISPECIES: hypothetical protein [unclassified Salinicola]